MPTISVIVPVYNVEKYLRCCVDSILAQTFTDIEVLLVDDGSTDGSGAICDEYAQKDSRVRVFHKPNGGVSSARNLGLDKAAGKWIMFVDSDDKVAPQICERLLEYATDDCMPMCTYYEWRGDEFKRSLPEVNPTEIYPIIEYLRLGNRIMVWGKLYKRAIIELTRKRFEEKTSFAEDAIFNYDYIKDVGCYCLIDEPLYYYRILQNSLSHGRYIPNFEETIRLLYERKKNLFEKLGIDASKDVGANYFFSTCCMLQYNMCKEAPGTWIGKMRKNNAILRSEEFKKVYPYRYERPKDFTKRYIRMLEFSYHTGNYFWLWLVGVPGKIKEAIKRKK